MAGGAPFRLVRLTEGGAAHLRRWRQGDRVGDEAGARALARRLLDAGILLSDGAPPTPDAEADVIVPVHDRADQLERCLASLGEHRRLAIVVDDGSSDPSGIAAVAAAHGVRLVRLPRNRGAAAARNAGLSATTRPLVAFVDSDVTVEPGWLARLLGHFEDPAVAMAAPRVLPARDAGSGWLATYESRHSPLDMGPTPGDAGPGRRVPYVVSAALVARRSAIGSGFVEALSIGEDVDLCWRLTAAGWRVVHDPLAAVRHDHRVRLGPLVRRRWTYGRSVGPLARRHPTSLPPLRASAFTSGALAVATSGRPLAALGIVAVRGATLRRQLRGDTELAALVTGQDLWSTAVATARALRRAWAPALACAAVRAPRARRMVALALVLRLAEQDRPALRHLPLAVLDDLLAALALWAACAEHRVLDPLLPRLRR